MLAVGGAFAIIPNISAYVQFNHGYPREALGRLYLFGGAISFLVMQLAGYLADRLKPALVALAGSVLMAIALLSGFVFDTFYLPIIVVFVIFMSAQGVRNVAVNALTSRVPAPQERAGFHSAQSAVQSLAMALGSLLSTRMLTQGPDQHLSGMPLVAGIAVVAALSAPLLLFAVQRWVVLQEQALLAEPAGRLPNSEPLLEAEPSTPGEI
jgi:predicted MFS family arabinose efflux permease